MEGQGVLEQRQTGPGLFIKGARLVGSLLFAIILVVMLALVFFLVQGRLTGGAPAIAGHQLYVVLSGSMSPAFEAGSMVVVRPVDPAQLEPGDVITFQGFESGDTLVTHRIVEVHSGEGLSFTTRGDNNNVNDPEPVQADKVVGQVVLSIPYAGHVTDFAGTKQGLLTLVIIPGSLIIAFELRNLYRYATELDKEQDAKKRAKAAGGEEQG